MKTIFQDGWRRQRTQQSVSFRQTCKPLPLKIIILKEHCFSGLSWIRFFSADLRLKIFFSRLLFTVEQGVKGIQYGDADPTSDYQFECIMFLMVLK